MSPPYFLSDFGFFKLAWYLMVTKISYSMPQRIKSHKPKPHSLSKRMKNERQQKQELHKNPNLQAKRKKLAS